MSPHIFPIDGCLATSMRLLSENRLTHCSTSNIRTHRWDPAPRCLLFSCFLEGLVWLLGPNDIQGSPEHFQTLRSPSRPSGEWAHHFQGWVRQSECPINVRELQSHFKQGCSDSHCTTPPADFNRCPTSFKRDHYQHSTAPMVTTLLFQSASLSRYCPCRVGTALYYQPVNETLCTDSTDQALFPWCTEKSFPSPITPRKQDRQNLTFCPIKIACCSESQNANNSWIL